MKAIVVTDKSAGTAGMKLAEKPDPTAGGNDVVVEIHASGFTPGELTWPGTWTDREGRDRTPSVPGHEFAGVVTGVLNDEAAGVYEAVIGERGVGGVTYNLLGEERIALLAVSVFPEFRGQGVAYTLIHAVLEDVRAQGRTVTNYCPVVATFIDEHRTPSTPTSSTASTPAHTQRGVGRDRPSSFPNRKHEHDHHCGSRSSKS